MSGFIRSFRGKCVGFTTVCCTASVGIAGLQNPRIGLGGLAVNCNMNMLGSDHYFKSRGQLSVPGVGMAFVLRVSVKAFQDFLL